jgi:HK97 family phage major capsid protein
MSEEIGYGFADKEDEAGFNGDGSGTYHGVFGLAPKINDGNHTAGCVTLGSGDLAFSDLVIGDFENLIGTLPVYAQANAKWYISNYGFANSMARLADAAGGTTMEHYANGMQLSFLGYPVVRTQVLTSATGDTASTTLCLLGDLNLGCTLGERTGMSIQFLRERYADTLQTGVIPLVPSWVSLHQHPKQEKSE